MLLASQPAPALRHLIRHYYQVKDSLVGRVSLQPVPARSPQILEFMFGTHYQVRRRGCEATENVRAVALLVGARTSPSAELIVDAFTIVFLPGAFSMQFGVPADELTNWDFDGREVLGKRINELQCRLGEAAAFHDRVCVADNALSAVRPATEPIFVKLSKLDNSDNKCIFHAAGPFCSTASKGEFAQIGALDDVRSQRHFRCSSLALARVTPVFTQ